MKKTASRTRTKGTLKPGTKLREPYCWLRGDDAYQLPVEWQEMMAAVPEQEAMRIIASFDEASFGRQGMFINPIFTDPDYGALSLVERKFIGTIVSSINHCVTCLLIHGHALGELMGDHGRARRLAINYRTVSLNARELAIADYTTKITAEPGKTGPDDLQRLRDVGLSDAEIFGVVEVAAVFNLTNRFTAGLGMRPDDEFLTRITPTLNA